MFDTGKDNPAHGHLQQLNLHEICAHGRALMVQQDVTNRADVYAQALRHFRRSYPWLDPYKHLSSAIGVGESAFRQKCQDGRLHFTVVEEEQLFRLCGFPEGFTMKLALVFNMPPPQENT